MSWKQILTFILIMCATATSFGQEITGISDFKIGMSMEEFLELPLIKEKNIQDKASQTSSTCELCVWKTSVDSPVDKYIRVYSADIVQFEFKAPMGVPKTFKEDSYDTKIQFYKGKLASVYVFDTQNFYELLTAKYGRPIEEDKTKLVKCQNGYGAKSEHFAGTNSSIWGKGKKITATLREFFWGCGRGDRSYTVEDVAIAKILHRIEESGRKALEAEDAKLKVGASKL